MGAVAMPMNGLFRGTQIAANSASVDVVGAKTGRTRGVVGSVGSVVPGGF